MSCCIYLDENLKEGIIRRYDEYPDTVLTESQEWLEDKKDLTNEEIKQKLIKRADCDYEKYLKTEDAGNIHYIYMKDVNNWKENISENISEYYILKDKSIYLLISEPSYKEYNDNFFQYIDYLYTDGVEEYIKHINNITEGKKDYIKYITLEEYEELKGKNYNYKGDYKKKIEKSFDVFYNEKYILGHKRYFYILTQKKPEDLCVLFGDIIKYTIYDKVKKAEVLLILNDDLFEVLKNDIDVSNVHRLYGYSLIEEHYLTHEDSMFYYTIGGGVCVISKSIYERNKEKFEI